jgi:hypothetical protein
MLEILAIIVVAILFITSIIILIMDKNSKTIGAIFLILSIIVSSILIIFFINRKITNDNFKNSKETYYLVTKDLSNGNKKNYYEINDKGQIRKIDKFKYSEVEYYKLKDCFDSYVDHNANKVLNTYTKETCKAYDKNDNEIELNDTMINMIKEASKLEHSIYGFHEKIIIVDGEYYMNLSFNVNMWDPFKVFKFDGKKLKHLYTFNNEEIIFIKKK